jgi:hypothetical protein
MREQIAMEETTEYILFLDESKDTPPSKLFALGGVAIERNNYKNNIIPYIEKLKIDVFNSKDVILHETDIRDACEKDYLPMRKKENRDMFWDRMGKLFDGYNIKVFNAVVTPSLCKKTYNSKYLNNEYFIALQIILENYVHFLEKNKAIGSICIESRNLKENNRLHNHYEQLKKHGTLFINNFGMIKCITTLSFCEKFDNIIGLQIADFIPNVFKKYSIEEKQRNPSILSNMCNCLYDGNVNDINRFGNKKVF